MESRYSHLDVEDRIYKMWEQGGYFEPKADPAKKPFTIILPPPNASGKMHTGNVLMMAIEDLLIRWHRMKGDPTLWLPGTDHAGIETQTTFERELKKQGKSRFDFDRQTLYQMIWNYVQENKGLILQQFRQMGASVDWTRLKFSLDEDVLKTVYGTFIQMEKEGLVYRGNYLVNYSFKWGTTFSDAEIQYAERVDPLYYMKYGPFVLATVRPETKFGDTAVAVNPKDKRYKKFVGQEIEVDGLNGPFKLKVIEDSYVDMKFGTGVVKITPAHDKNDFEVGRRHNLEVKNVIDTNGRLNDRAGKYTGMTILDARKQVVADLNAKGLIVKVDENYTHQIPVDYRSGDYIENLVLPNWFIKVDDHKHSLKKLGYDAVKSGEIKIYPKWREITYIRWMENLHDWAISRQNVWGIRIPVWYEVEKNKDKLWVSWLDENKKQQQGNLQTFLDQGISLETIKVGLQRLMALSVGEQHPSYIVSVDEPNDGMKYLPETDTFDTWFSSGQWPYATLGYPDSDDFKYFYPTSVLETGWEIVTRWVSRMVMFGLYRTGKVPFENVYLHGHVRAIDGRKMSKSLGNVINPDDYLSQYGADVLRMGLISGTAGGKDFNFPQDKIIAYRNFANKIWNVGRFIMMNIEGKKIPSYSPTIKTLTKEDKTILRRLKSAIKKVESDLEKFRFAQAAEVIYKFVWHELADTYIENCKLKIENLETKQEEKLTSLTVLLYCYTNSLKLLHPFMPFITEEIWGLLPHQEKKPLIVTPWPKG